MVLYGKSLEEYTVTARVPQGFILGPTSFTRNFPDDVICNIAINTDDYTVFSKCYQASDLWQQLELASQLECDLQDTEDCRRKWLMNPSYPNSGRREKRKLNFYFSF